MDRVGFLRLEHRGMFKMNAATAAGNDCFHPKVISAILHAGSVVNTHQTKLLIYLLGNRGDGSFLLDEHAICQVCDFSAKQLHNALRELGLRGWIGREDDKVIVDIDRFVSGVGAL